MTEPPTASCRIYAILARDGRSAVVFRRGPSRQVLVLRWWLDGDRIETGQWLKGRIYERRCDLAPDGDLLIYFAAKWETPMSTWTAVSRTPYLTALALWPKGDAWGGGGVFDSARVIGLNYREIGPAQSGTAKTAPGNWHPLGPETQEAPDNPIPKRFKVPRWSEHAGLGEDNPILHHRATRDGWMCVDQGEAGRHGETQGYSWVLNSPEIYERPSPASQSPGGPVLLKRILKAVGQRDGPWYVEDFELHSADGAVLRRIPECSWADWQNNGDLLFAQGSCLYRVPMTHTTDEAGDPFDNAKPVADLGPLTFTPAISPEWARTWP